ncbi:MAG: hypothetical protein MUE50_24400 [Pirellulaceae bacterium]|jgi:non-homologous end joining protein Ku|nr:hypothetical protein [Pirellulaceae bacterium]MCU0978687.1 hypothetical protein [Pirellulaceae bacterium]
MSTPLLVDRPPAATAPPATRASWTGQLRLGSCGVPVKAYPREKADWRRAGRSVPVDHDAVEIDRKEVDTFTRWIESMDEPIHWQELRDASLPRSGCTS